MKTLPVAVQVYSVREDAEKDFAGTMKKIKEIMKKSFYCIYILNKIPQRILPVGIINY